LKCALQPKIAKENQQKVKNPFLKGGDSWSFKVIDVDESKCPSPVPVMAACLCISATVFTLHEIIAVK